MTDGELKIRHRMARVAGLFYLAYIVIFAWSSITQGELTGGSDATATVKTILAAEGLYRLAIMGEVVSVLLFIMAAWALFVLLKPAGKNLALLFLILNLSGAASECASVMVHFAALPLLHGAAYLKGFPSGQLPALARLFLSIDSGGITVLFFGVWLFPLGYLVIKSGFLPRFLGVLLFLDGLSLMICFVQLWLFPAYQRLTYPLYPIMFVAESALALWLLVMGARGRKMAVP